MTPPELDDLYRQYPSLSESGHRITSQATDEYNCAGWVPRHLTRWYEPGMFWPSGVPEPADADDLDCYVALFESWGYEPCSDASHEDGFLKIAIYAIEARFCHVAKQIRDNGWSSKGGTLYDFQHDTLEALYPSGIMENARPTVFMRRRDDGTDPQHLERAGLLPL